MRLDQQPVVALLAAPAAHAHQVPETVQLLAVERERQMALAQALVRIVLRLPAAAVPDHHRAAAVFALRDGALEFVVVDRVVLDLHGEPLVARHQARTARHRPAFHDAVKFEPQVVVQTARRVLLDDEGVAFAARDLALRLGGDAELAFGAVDFQPRHLARLSNRRAAPFALPVYVCRFCSPECGGRPWRCGAARPSD